MENSSLSLSEAPIVGGYSQLIQSLNESRELKSSGSPPQISEDSEILLLSILGHEERALASFPPEVDICTEVSRPPRLQFYFKRWALALTLLRIRRACLRSVMNKWRKEAEISYIADVRVILGHLCLSRAFSAWRMEAKERIVSAVQHRRTLQKSFLALVECFNRLEIAEYEILRGVQRKAFRELRELARTFIFERRRVLALQACAFRMLNQTFRSTRSQRKMLLRVSLASMAKEYVYRTTVRPPSKLRGQTVESLQIFLERESRGRVWLFDTKEASSESAHEIEQREQEEYFKNENRRFVLEKTKEFAEECDSRQDTMLFVEPPQQLAGALPLAELEVSLSVSEDLGQLAGLVKNTAFTEEREKIARLHLEISRAREVACQIASSRYTKGYGEILTSSEIGREESQQIAEAAPVANCQTLADVLRAGCERVLVKRAFYCYYTTMLEKVAYNAKSAVGRLYYGRTRLERVFLALISKYREIERKRVVISRARSACMCCFRLYYLRLWLERTRLARLDDLKVRFLERNHAFWMMSNCFLSMYNKYHRLTRTSHSMIAFRNSMQRAVMGRIFEACRRRYAGICKIQAQAQEMYAQRLRFRAFYIFHLFLLKRHSYHVANTVFNGLFAFSWKQCRYTAPGGWYDESFPGVRQAFAVWRSDTQYRLILRVIETKIGDMRCFTLKRRALAALVRLYSCELLQRAHSEGEAHLILDIWRRLTLFRQRLRWICRNVERKCAAEMLAQWRDVVAASQFSRIATLRSSLRAMIGGYYRHSSLRDLSTALEHNCSVFIKYKAMFALSAGRGASVQEEAKLLRSPAFEFSKCMTFKKRLYQRNLLVSSLIVVSYNVESPEFSCKLSFLRPERAKIAQTDFAYDAIREHLRRRILQTGSAASNALTLSQLDRKMDGIQERIARLQ